MNKKVTEATEILDSLFLINHHVKDLQKLRSYVEYCMLAQEKNGNVVFSEYSREQGKQLNELLEHDIELCSVSKEHYHIDLKVYLNWNFGFPTDLLLKFKNTDKIPTESPRHAIRSASSWLELYGMGGVLTDDDNFVIRRTDHVITGSLFFVPECDLLAFKTLLNKDIANLYDLKEKIINLCLTAGEDYSITVKITRRQIDNDGRKYVCISLNDGDYKFHYPSDRLYEELFYLPSEPYTAGSGKTKMFCLEKEKVTTAISTLKAVLEDYWGRENI
jgi:hypothetical protein